jgi:FMN phosphatase YigB (HAD superfamily)
MNIRYDLLVFDLWQTLISHAFGRNLHSHLSEHLKIKDRSLLKILTDAWMVTTGLEVRQFAEMVAVWLSHHEGRRNISQTRQQVIDLVDEHTVTDYNKAFWLKGAEQTLHDLRNEGVPLVLVSNTIPSSKDLAGKLGLFDLLDELILSCDVGFLKPNPLLFLASKLISEAYRTGKKVCVIGDRFDTDVLGAQVLGFDSIQLLQVVSVSRKEGLADAVSGDTGPVDTLASGSQAHSYEELRQLLGMESL